MAIEKFMKEYATVYVSNKNEKDISNLAKAIMERDVRKGKGLQYIRSVIISDYDICVINRHLFL